MKRLFPFLSFVYFYWHLQFGIVLLRLTHHWSWDHHQLHSISLRFAFSRTFLCAFIPNSLPYKILCRYTKYYDEGHTFRHHHKTHIFTCSKIVYREGPYNIVYKAHSSHRFSRTVYFTTWMIHNNDVLKQEGFYLERYTKNLSQNTF